jgi:RimJ/RimL family protein N-acetyltransferase
MTLPDTVFELAPDKIEIARPLFAGATFDRVFIDAFFEGRQIGRLFVDDPDHPTGALLCRSYDYFPAGETAPALRRFIADAPSEPGVFDTLSSLRVARQAPTIAFYGFVPVTDAWRNALLEDVPGLESIARRAFQLSPERAASARSRVPRLPDGFVLRPIDRELARRLDEELDEVLALFWGDYDRYAADGFGACAMAGNEIASINFANAVSDREANLGVVTVEHYRQRGLATAVSFATINQALERGLIPTWDCDAANTTSAHLAEKLGFTEEPSFAELAFPHRAGPALSSGVWSSEPSSTGTVLWRRNQPSHG